MCELPIMEYNYIQEAHENRLNELEKAMSDVLQRFDTLQTPLWKRIWFRIDGWPGQRDLNAAEPAWRPWRKWYKS